MTEDKAPHDHPLSDSDTVLSNRTFLYKLKIQIPKNSALLMVTPWVGSDL